jgi:hypothetical protein
LGVIIVYRSTDGGSKWELVLKDPFVMEIVTDPHSPGVVYAGTGDHPYHDQSTGNGLFRSDDSGQSWYSVNEGLTNLSIWDLVIDPSNPSILYLGTGGNGVFKGGVYSENKDLPSEEIIIEEDVASESESEALKSDSFVIELGGVWEGVTTSDFLIIFEFDSSCNLSEICGSFEIPDFSLTGEIIFTEVKGNECIFQVTNLSSGQTGNPYESLTLLDDGTLKYYTTDYTTESEAILVRK